MGSQVKKLECVQPLGMQLYVVTNRGACTYSYRLRTLVHATADTEIVLAPDAVCNGADQHSSKKGAIILLVIAKVKRAPFSSKISFLW
jgi:hypothetical protein